MSNFSAGGSKDWLVQMRLAGLGACLADDMGLGKTLQTIVLLLHERQALGIERPALVICPTSVLGNWRHEIERFAPDLQVMAHHGPERLEGEAFAKAARRAAVVLITYALLSRYRETLGGVEWVFRLPSEPAWLWRRYLIYNPLFLWNVFLQETHLKHWTVDGG